MDVKYVESEMNCKIGQNVSGKSANTTPKTVYTILRFSHNPHRTEQQQLQESFLTRGKLVVYLQMQLRG